MSDYKFTFSSTKLIVGRFKFISELSSGGNGFAYRVEDNQYGGRNAVLKVPKNTGAVASLHDEIDTLRTLNHPNLITFYYSGYEATIGDFYAMEMAQGERLDKWHKHDEPLTAAEIVAITRQVCDALDFIHNRRCIIHFDIKPANLFYDRESGQVRLIDFGEAVQFDPLKGYVCLSEFRGTKSYSAPELAADKAKFLRKITPAADIYALGLVLRELIAGASATKEKLRRACQRSGLPLEMVDLICRMLERKPENRPNAGQLLQALEELDVAGQQKEPERPFLGRESELEELEKQLALCANGQGQLYVLAGLAGIGKSQLAIRLVELAEQHNFLTTTSRYSGQDVRPYAPLVRLVRTCIDRAGLSQSEPEVTRLAEWLPELTITDVETSLPPAEVSDSALQALREALLALFKRIATAQPLLLYLDDAHAVDNTLLKLLKELNAGLQDLKVLICLTFRSETAQEQQRLKDLGDVATLVVKPLDQTSIEKLLCQTFGREPDSQRRLSDMAKLLEQRTGGRPLMLDAALRLMEKEQVINRSGSWQLDDLVALKNLKIKTRHNQVLQDRLGLLEPIEHDLTVLGAVLGAEIEPEVLAVAIAGLVKSPYCPPEMQQRLQKLTLKKLKARLERLHQLQILERSTDGSGRYRFYHDLLYQTAREQISIEGLIIGEVLSEHFNSKLTDPNTQPVPEPSATPFALAINKVDPSRLLLLATCFEGSGLIYAATGFSLLVAETALAQNAFDRALEWYERAQAQLKRALDPGFAEECETPADIPFVQNCAWVYRTHFWILKGMAQSQFYAGRYKFAEVYTKEAIKFAQNHTEDITAELLAQIYLVGAEVLRELGKYSALLKLVSTPFMQHLTSSDALAARIISYHALQRTGRKRARLVRKLAEDMLTQTLQVKDRISEGRTYNLLAIIDNYLGYWQRARQNARNALHIFEELDIPLRVVQSLGNIGIVAHNLNLYEEEYQCFERNLKILNSQIENYQFIIQAYIGFGEYYRGQKCFEQAEDYYLLAHKVAGAIEDKETDAVNLMNLGALYTAQDEHLEKALPYLEEAKRVYSKGEYKTKLPELFQHFALYHLKNGEGEQALSSYNEAIRWSIKTQNWAEMGRACYSLAEFYSETSSQKALGYLYRSWRAWSKLENYNEMRQVASQLHHFYLALAERADANRQKQLKQLAARWEKKAQSLKANKLEQEIN